jgi:hypothetical protein
LRHLLEKVYVYSAVEIDAHIDVCEKAPLVLLVPVWQLVCWEGHLLEKCTCTALACRMPL